MASSPSGTRPETAEEMKSRLYWEKQNEIREDKNTWIPIIIIVLACAVALVIVMAR